MVEVRLQPRGDIVLGMHVGIGEEFEIAFRVMRQQGLEEIIDHMIAKIAGDIADPQPPAWVRHVVKARVRKSGAATASLNWRA